MQKPQMVLGNQGRLIGNAVGESRWKTGKSGDTCPILVFRITGQMVETNLHYSSARNRQDYTYLFTYLSTEAIASFMR